MHPSAMKNGRLFFQRYLPYVAEGNQPRIIEIGSQDVNGSLRQACQDTVDYIGVDFVPGKGVDRVLDDPYQLPFADHTADVIVSSSCFEHSEFFWLLFLEVIRVLKPHGLFYLNAPSNGSFHRYPVDCWRFYPDSGQALVNWSKRNGYNTALMESFTSQQMQDCWNDYVAVFVKNEHCAVRYPEKIFTGRDDVENVRVLGQAHLSLQQEMTQDQRELAQSKQKLASIDDILRR